jgi:hypothetical protein
MAKTSSESTDETPGMVPIGKGHATPKRKEREAAQRRPLVASSKEDSKRRRAEQRARSAKEQAALQTGDERYMPRQHAGAPRRFARDFVDARTTVSEFLLPAAVVSMIALIFLDRYPEIVNGIGTALLLMMVAWTIESAILTRKMRKQATAKFGAEHLPRMYAVYGVTRMMQLRRFRLPKAQVTRGQYPV